MKRQTVYQIRKQCHLSQIMAAADRWTRRSHDQQVVLWRGRWISLCAIRRDTALSISTTLAHKQTSHHSTTQHSPSSTTSSSHTRRSSQPSLIGLSRPTWHRPTYSPIDPCPRPPSSCRSPPWPRRYSGSCPVMILCRVRSSGHWRNSHLGTWSTVRE